MSGHVAYLQYRDSELDWVGPIPADWEVLPFFRFAKQCKRSNRGMVNDNLLSLSYGNVIRKNIDGLDGLLPESFETYQIVEPDDVVFRLTDLQNDKRSLRSALCPELGIITSAYLAVAPREIQPPFLAYLMRAYDLTKVFYSLGSGLRQSLKYDEMKRLPLVVPSQEEQTQIAKFLDYETAKIDRLIDKQQQLIALLKEKRQAVISHAVTKGLNPDAPMKDSGVEWLAEVPAHWEVLKGSWLGQLFGSESVPEDHVLEDGPLLFIKVSSLSLAGFELAERRFFVSSTFAGSVSRRSGFVVFPKRGAAIFTNKVNIVTEPAVIDPNLMGWIPKARAEPEYLAYVLKLRGLDDIADVSTVPQINNKHIAPMMFPVPPKDEQVAILQHLKRRLATLGQLTDKAEEQIDLLQERRTALISAAVTGKIDVRGWKPPPDTDPDSPTPDEEQVA